MAFQSILFEGLPAEPTAATSEDAAAKSEGAVATTDGTVATTEGTAAKAQAVPPECFRDLHLDRIVGAITAGREAYQLAPLFYTPLREVSTIRYRHDVFRDLEREALARPILRFAEGMRQVRGRLAEADKLHYAGQKQRCFLDAVALYCAAVAALTRDLAGAEPRSRGLRGFGDFLDGYTASGPFTALQSQTHALQESLAAIQYGLAIDGTRIEVRRYESEADYGAEVLETFEKFKQGAARTYSFKFYDSLDMNHVEAAILERVALLFPEVFSALSRYCESHRDWLDPTIRRFDREVQFYLAYLEHAARFKPAALLLCYPEVTDASKDVRAHAAFDLALADRLAREGTPVVTNDFHLEGCERILVVSGANQGGKTTFARMFGQLHYLASLGCPVPAREARLFLFDRLFSHFEREEQVESLSGKLEEELVRMHTILREATPSSIVIMNESFGSTTLADALFLSKAVLQRIIERDALCVCVTFLDELASLGPQTVSMMSTVDPRDPAVRTFKVIRRPADGLAYAAAIAQKYRLSYRDVKERIAP